jgi:hypothetical protein
VAEGSGGSRSPLELHRQSHMLPVAAVVSMGNQLLSPDFHLLHNKPLPMLKTCQTQTNSSDHHAALV